MVSRCMSLILLELEEHRAEGSEEVVAMRSTQAHPIPSPGSRTRLASCYRPGIWVSVAVALLASSEHIQLWK